MKKTILFPVLILMLALLAGCGCKHEWKDATCTEPKTCELCGETEGEPLGHKWEDATCTEPKTCAVCGETEGKPLGHKKVDATCTEPMTCAVCGETKGEPLGHDWEAATIDAPKTCKRCGETEGEPVFFKTTDAAFLKDVNFYYVIDDHIAVAEIEDPKHCYTYRFYDLQGTLLAEQVNDTRITSSTYNGYCTQFSDDCFLLSLGTSKDTQIRIFDYDQNLICEKTVDRKEADVYKGKRISMDDTGYDGLYRVYNVDKDTTLFYVDVNKGGECAEREYEAAKKAAGADEGFDEDKYCCYEYQEAFDGYFFGTADDETWGYLDRDGNEIASYKDASAFNASGYALVTNDGHSYDLIDSDMNVVGKDVVQGVGAALRHGDLFVVYQGEDEDPIYAVAK